MEEAKITFPIDITKNPKPAVDVGVVSELSVPAKGSDRRKHALRIIIDVLGLIGIGVGIVSYFDVRRIEDKIDVMLKDQGLLAEKQQPVKEELAKSTVQYLGTWPGLQPALRALLLRTEQELDIMTGPLGYGMFSRPEEFREYLAIIKQNLIRGNKVRILINAPSVEMQQIRNQFLLVDFEELKRKPEFERFISIFAKPPSSYDDFVNNLLKMEQSYTAELLNLGAQIRYSSSPIATFFWGRDKVEGIISFERTSGSTRESSFLTRDVHLLQELQSLFDEQWLRSNPIASRS